jgi:hypothetical protein
MKKSLLIFALCLTGVSTSYLSAKSSVEVEVDVKKEVKVEEKVNYDCTSYALGVMDRNRAIRGWDLSPHDYNLAFSWLELECEENQNVSPFSK